MSTHNARNNLRALARPAPQARNSLTCYVSSTPSSEAFNN